MLLGEKYRETNGLLPTYGDLMNRRSRSLGQTCLDSPQCRENENTKLHKTGLRETLSVNLIYAGTLISTREPAVLCVCPFED